MRLQENRSNAEKNYRDQFVSAGVGTETNLCNENKDFEQIYLINKKKQEQQCTK